jgi:uncharacterized protein (DUF1501 family)
MNTYSRRGFLQASIASTLTALAHDNAFASTAADDDYKALICIFLFGGNDGNSTLIANDNDTWARYSAIRNATSGIALDRASLAPVQFGNAGGQPFAMHPSLSNIAKLIEQGFGAAVANVGTLTQPMTVAQYKSGADRPLSLLSHSDQQLQWQTAVYEDFGKTGWGARVADRLAPLNTAERFPVITSTFGNVPFVNGLIDRPFVINPRATYSSLVFGSYLEEAGKQLTRLAEQVASTASNDALTSELATLHAEAYRLTRLTSSFATSQPASVTQALSGVCGQPLRFALNRNITKAKRQIFFVGIQGFDTHAHQNPTQSRLLKQLDNSIASFFKAVEDLKLTNNITIATLSDFGRTLKGAAGGGTDHAWGNHHFVFGGAVNGGKLFGNYPTLALGGPDDISQEGRWLPTTSIEQYFAPLLKWLGLPESDLPYVFPSLNRFDANALQLIKT